VGRSPPFVKGEGVRGSFRKSTPTTSNPSAWHSLLANGRGEVDIAPQREHPPGLDLFFVVLDFRHEIMGGMAEHVYKKIEIVGSSPNGFEEAVQNALTRARKTIRNMRWFEVSETRGYIEEGDIAHWQVTLKIGFTLDE
jgi:dodecin